MVVVWQEIGVGHTWLDSGSILTPHELCAFEETPMPTVRARSAAAYKGVQARYKKGRPRPQ